MFVNNLMMPLSKLITVNPEDNLEYTLEQIVKNNLLSIPVQENEKFLGAVSKDKIHEYYFDNGFTDKSQLKNVKVQDILRTDIPILDPFDKIEKAAHYLAIKNIPFVAVVNSNNDFLGIITHIAIFRQFTEIFGLNKGKRIAVIAYDIPGQMWKLTKIVSENNSDIISLVVIDPKLPTDVKELVLRVNTENFNTLVEEIKKAGFKIN